MTIKKLRLSGDFVDFDVVLEINDELLTQNDLHEINNFWGDSENRLFFANGDVLKVVLGLLYNTLLQLQVQEGNYNAQGVIGLFDWDHQKGQEGWPKMDGSMGIRILEIDEVIFDETPNITEVA